MHPILGKPAKIWYAMMVSKWNDKAVLCAFLPVRLGVQLSATFFLPICSVDGIRSIELAMALFTSMFLAVYTSLYIETHRFMYQSSLIMQSLKTRALINNHRITVAQYNHCPVELYSRQSLLGT